MASQNDFQLPHNDNSRKIIDGYYLAYFGRKPALKEQEMWYGKGTRALERALIKNPQNIYGVGKGAKETIVDPKMGTVKTTFSVKPLNTTVTKKTTPVAKKTETTPTPIKPYEQVEPFVEDWKRWRKMGKEFVGKQYDEMITDLLEEKQLKEKSTRDDLDEMKIRELESRTTFRSKALEDFNRNMSETKGDFDKSLQRMEEDKTLWQSQEAQDYNDAVKTRKEEFNRRGLVYSGFQEEAASKQELERTEKIKAYETTYGRELGDITQQYGRTKEELERGNTRALEDYEKAYTQQLNDWERQYGLKKPGGTAYTYGYKKGEDIKYGVDYLGTEAKGLEDKGYTAFGYGTGTGSSPYEIQKAYEKAATQTERDRIAAQEEYATQKRTEEKEAYEARRKKYYESQGYLTS
jgi:uncharacterized coiled-coil protein SlyX